MAFTPIPRPPRATRDGQRDPLEVSRWYDAVWKALSGVASVAWGAVDFSGSNLSDIETRPHSDLQGVTQADDTSTDTTGGKHVTDALIKTYADHSTASTDVHGVGSGSSVVGTATTQRLTNKTFGTTTDYAEFEADGSLFFYGDATVFEDLQGSALSLKQQGTGVSQSATENTVVFNTSANLSDYLYDNFQVEHAWKLGSDLRIHAHWEQSESNRPNFLVRYRWQVQGAAKTTSWTDLPFTTDAFTYVSGTLNQISYGAVIPPPGGAGLSDILDIQFFRDTSNASAAFSGADPYTTAVSIKFLDIHIERNTMGSREEYVK